MRIYMFYAERGHTARAREYTQRTYHFAFGKLALCWSQHPGLAMRQQGQLTERDGGVGPLRADVAAESSGKTPKYPKEYLQIGEFGSAH
jgi:hypothetical protein